MINATPARAEFKRHLGQANHFLVTALVALHHLEASDLAVAPAELRTSWNPKDRVASIARTRIFVTQSFLGWAVDSIDLYLSLLNRKPKFVRDPNVISSLDGAGRSVLRKAQIMSKHYDVPPPTCALVDILITWRNNVFHELADNSVADESRQALVVHAAFIETNYRGLRPDGLPDKAEAGDSLTFKEAASLIHAAHRFVEAIDAAVLLDFDQRTYCFEAVLAALNDKNQDRRFAAKYLSLTLDKRRRFVNNWLKNALGFATVPGDILDACSVIQRHAD
jgi:hypothetical protein